MATATHGYDAVAMMAQRRARASEERSRLAALAAAGVADVRRYECSDDDKPLNFGTTNVLVPVGGVRDVRPRVEAREAKVQLAKEAAAERAALEEEAPSSHADSVDSVEAARAQLAALKRKRPQ